MSDLNIREAEERAKAEIASFYSDRRSPACIHAQNVLALAAAYREAVATLSVWFDSDGHPEYQADVEAVLAKARAALGETK